MKKYLIFFSLFVSIGTTYAQQSDPCEGQSRACSDGSGGICTRMRGTAPYEGEPPAQYALLCFIDGEAPPPTFIKNNNKTPKKRLCDETLKPVIIQPPQPISIPKHIQQQRYPFESEPKIASANAFDAFWNFITHKRR